MGTTLSGSRIKDSYTGILKTADNTGLTTAASGYHVISDGAGTDSGLSLSTDVVKVASLVVSSADVDASLTKTLVIDNLGVVHQRPFPSEAGIIMTSAGNSTLGGSTPTVAFSGTGGGGGGTLTFTGGDGVNVSRTGNNLTFESGTKGINTIAPAGGAAISLSATTQVNKAFYIDYSSTATSSVINLPPASAGLNIKLVIKAGRAGVNQTIVSASGDKLFGKATLTKTATAPSVHVIAHSASITTLTFNSSSPTTGGAVGDIIYLEAIDSTSWFVIADLTTTGALGTAAVFS